MGASTIVIGVMRTVIITAACVALLSGVATGQETPPDPTAQDVEALAEKANTLYQARKYDQAIRYYLQAYKLGRTAALLYNVAYIYDRDLKDTDLAIAFYRRYITAPDADPELVQQATGRIRELKAAARRPVVTRPPVTPPILVDTKPEPGMRRRTWGYITMGAGGALVIGGITLAVLAKQTHDDFKTTTELSKRLTLQDRGRSLAIAGDVLWAVGAAGVVAGLVLTLTDLGDKTSSLPVEIGASPIHGGGMLLLGGRM